MRSSALGKRPTEQPTVKRWCGRLLAYGVALGLLALAAGVATSERSHRDEPRDEPAAIAGTVQVPSGGGNLVPLY
jgi:hypothetical protein